MVLCPSMKENHPKWFLMSDANFFFFFRPPKYFIIGRVPIDFFLHRLLQLHLTILSCCSLFLLDEKHLLFDELDDFLDISAYRVSQSPFTLFSVNTPIFHVGYDAYRIDDDLYAIWNVYFVHST